MTKSLFLMEENFLAPQLCPVEILQGDMEHEGSFGARLDPKWRLQAGGSRLCQHAGLEPETQVSH